VLKALSILTFGVNAGPRHSPNSLSRRKSGFDYREVHVELNDGSSDAETGVSSNIFTVNVILYTRKTNLQNCKYFPSRIFLAFI
jgi:hypothetical protein